MIASLSFTKESSSSVDKTRLFVASDAAASICCPRTSWRPEPLAPVGFVPKTLADNSFMVLDILSILAICSLRAGLPVTIGISDISAEPRV